jgi:hypothetical protein
MIVYKPKGKMPVNIEEYVVPSNGLEFEKAVTALDKEVGKSLVKEEVTEEVTEEVNEEVVVKTK